MSLKNPTLRDVAKAAGVGPSAASMALRHHPRIPEKTRVRIMEAAESLGYRPPAIYREAMAQLRRERKESDRDRLAWLAPRDLANRAPEYALQGFEDAQRTAHQHGYHFEPFWVDSYNLKAVIRTLIARGIRGALARNWGPALSALCAGDLEGLKVVTCDEGVTVDHGMARVVRDYEESMQFAMNEIRERGYRRPGLVTQRWLDKRQTLRNTFMAFRELMNLDGDIPGIHFRNIAHDGERFEAWYRQHQPDCILYMSSDIPSLLDEMGVDFPNEVGLVHLVKTSIEEDGELGRAVTGAYVPPEVLMQTATTLLASLLQHGESWNIGHAGAILISPSWWEGETLPERTPHAAIRAFRETRNGRIRFEPQPLDGHCNACFTGPLGWFGNHQLRGFRGGRRISEGVPFEIPKEGSQFILMRSELTRRTFDRKSLPESVRIPLDFGDEQPKYLYILHACAYADDSRPFATYAFHYADGSTIEQPVWCLHHDEVKADPPAPGSKAIVHDWWAGCAILETRDVKPHILNRYMIEELKGGHLYVWRWKNGRPEGELVALEITSDPTHATALALIGVTAGFE